MREYTTVVVPADLLPQVVGELLQYAVNPDHVEVVDGVAGREIHAHPEVAEAWYQSKQAAEEKAAPEPAPAPEPEPVKEPEKPVEEPAKATLAPVAPAPEQATRTTATKKNATSA